MTAIVYRDAINDGITGPEGVAMSADERLGQPLLKTGTRSRKRRVKLGLLLIVAGGASWYDPSIWPRSYSAAAPYASAAYDHALKLYDRIEWSAATGPVSPAPAASEKPLPKLEQAALSDTPPQQPEAERANAPAARPVVAAPAEPQGKAYEPSKAAAASASEVYTESSPVPTDPLKKRAAAAGLHPELPRAVLEKLSDADLKTASTAIRKALSSTDDEAVVIWPEKARQASAQFRVSFVEGAAPECRRYVVAIARDGWKTTALPVEKCAARRAAVSRS